jgi:hypothetical protein
MKCFCCFSFLTYIDGIELTIFFLDSFSPLEVKFINSALMRELFWELMS